MIEKQVYKKLLESLQEASKLVAKFASVSIPATMKKTPNGKYIVTFKI